MHVALGSSLLSAFARIQRLHTVAGGSSLEKTGVVRVCVRVVFVCIVARMVIEYAVR